MSFGGSRNRREPSADRAADGKGIATEFRMLFFPNTQRFASACFFRCGIGQLPRGSAILRISS
jgi:hypothetical protein